MKPTSRQDAIGRRVQAAQGKIPCDLAIRGARVLDVFHGQWTQTDLGIFDGVIVAIEKGIPAAREIDARGKWVAPGFIDAHVHVESSMLAPGSFASLVARKGTTTAICDPHELANVAGTRAIGAFLSAAETAAIDLRVMLPSCVPATHLETNGAGTLSAKDLMAFAGHRQALGLAEMMNFPGVLNGDAEVVEKLDSFMGKPLDGHCPMLRGAGLSAYAAAGISSCHETSELDEAHDKLAHGLSLWIREGSVAKDLKRLAPALTWETSTSVGFCTDDRNPLDILAEGHVDYLVRSAIREGVTPEVALRAASWSVARHYGLDRGWDRTGALAPGYRADLVILGDPRSIAVEQVLVRGLEPASAGAQAWGKEFTGSIRATVPESAALRGPEGRVKVIGIVKDKILTESLVANSSDRGIARLSVLERYGHGAKPANGYVRGFGEKFSGAIASSVGHDSHNLIVVGSSPEEMRVALASLIECGGGFAVAQGEKILARLELPIGGLMTTESPEAVERKLRALKTASKSIGCELPEPFLQLAFLSLPVIPSLKLTDKGLVDVDRFEIVSVSA